MSILYVVATPIGNLEDLSTRAIHVFENVDLIAAEDTRRTRTLLQHLGIKVPMIRCDEAAEEKAKITVLDRLSRGESVALVSDAGTPNVSDPGARLLEAVHNASHRVVPIPGPSATTALLSVCGFKTQPFTFFGFLPKKGKGRKEVLQAIRKGEEAVIFFESPQRLSETLKELASLDPERPACVGRELTKLHEEIARGTMKELASRFGDAQIKGECTVVVGNLTKALKRARKEEWKKAHG